MDAEEGVYEGPLNDLSAIGGHWGERQPLHHHGDGIVTGRKVAHIQGITWDYEPENCEATKNQWILDGTVLICTGCGLDGT